MLARATFYTFVAVVGVFYVRRLRGMWKRERDLSEMTEQLREQIRHSEEHAGPFEDLAQGRASKEEGGGK